MTMATADSTASGAIFADVVGVLRIVGFLVLVAASCAFSVIGSALMFYPTWLAVKASDDAKKAARAADQDNAPAALEVAAHTTDTEATHAADGEAIHAADGEASHAADGEASHAADGEASHAADGDASHAPKGDAAGSESGDVGPAVAFGIISSFFIWLILTIKNLDSSENASTNLKSLGISTAATLMCSGIFAVLAYTLTQLCLWYERRSNKRKAGAERIELAEARDLSELERMMGAEEVEKDGKTQLPGK